MANVDHRKYLEKYLDDDEKKHRKKKKREHSSSHSSRVKIVDDDAGYTHKKKYDDDDLILTGEDAPQIAGIIDERPPELQAAEDFRNSSKWRSLGDTERSHRTSDKNSDRKHNKSPPSRRDKSPDRRKDYKDISSSNARKRDNDDDDYSPVRRKRHDEGRPREANYRRDDRNTASSDESYARTRRREETSRSTRDNGSTDHRRQTEQRGKDSYDGYRKATYAREQQYSSRQSAQGSTSQYENRRKADSNENGRTTQSYSSQDRHRDEYSRAIRSEPVKSNPFRSNISTVQSISSLSRDGNDKHTAPAKSGNPFRANPRNASLSPLPEIRGKTSMNDKKFGGRSGNRGNSKSDFRHSSPEIVHAERHRTGFNPFRTDKSHASDSIAVSRSGSAMSTTKPVRSETAQTSYRTASHNRSEIQVTAHYGSATYDRKHEMSRSTHDDYRSRSPVKSSVHKVSDRHEKSRKYGECTYPSATQNFDGRKPLMSQVATTYYKQ